MLHDDDNGLPVMVAEYPGDGYLSDDGVDDLDSMSMASGNYGGGYWPAYTTSGDSRASLAVPELVTLRCRQRRPGNMDPPAALSSTSSFNSVKEPSTRNSLRRGHHQTSVGPFAPGFHRKSVCQTVLAGLKSFRRSIAGAGSSLLLHQPQQHQPQNTNNSSSQLSETKKNSPIAATDYHHQRILNRSSSVDATTTTSAGVSSHHGTYSSSSLLLPPTPSENSVPLPSPLTVARPSLRDNCTPVPMATTNRQTGGNSSRRLPPSASVPLSRLNEVATASTTTPNTMGGKFFPRSLTTSLAVKSNALTSSTTSLRNLFSAAFRGSNTPQSKSKILSKTTPRSSTVGLFTAPSPVNASASRRDEEGSVYSLPVGSYQPVTIITGGKSKPPTASSLLSLTSWDSTCTLDVMMPSQTLPEDEVIEEYEESQQPLLRIPRRNTVWETASQVDVTGEQLGGVRPEQGHRRSSFRALSMARRYLTTWAGTSKEDGPEGTLKEKTSVGGGRCRRKKSQALPQSKSFLENLSSRGDQKTMDKATITSRRSSACRRDSILLRGIFSR